MKITKKNSFIFEKYVSLIKSKNKLIEYEGKYATRCTNIPNISPDLIYLDGPSQYATKQNINGFNLNNISRFPMSADTLFRIFLEPGTFIIVDGRTANARFLKDHLKKEDGLTSMT